MWGFVQRTWVQGSGARGLGLGVQGLLGWDLKRLFKSEFRFRIVSLGVWGLISVSVLRRRIKVGFPGFDSSLGLS